MFHFLFRLEKETIYNGFDLVIITRAGHHPKNL